MDMGYGRRRGFYDTEDFQGLGYDSYQDQGYNYYQRPRVDRNRASFSSEGSLDGTRIPSTGAFQSRRDFSRTDKVKKTEEKGKKEQSGAKGQGPGKGGSEGAKAHEREESSDYKEEDYQDQRIPRSYKKKGISEKDYVFFMRTFIFAILILAAIFVVIYVFRRWYLKRQKETENMILRSRILPEIDRRFLEKNIKKEEHGHNLL